MSIHYFGLSSVPRTLRADASSPTALCHTGNVALKGMLPETESAERELPHIRPSPTAELASVPKSHLKLRRFIFLDDLRDRSHLNPLVRAERHPQQLEQPPPFFVSFGRRDHSDVHAASLIDRHIVDLSEHQLVA